MRCQDKNLRWRGEEEEEMIQDLEVDIIVMKETCGVFKLDSKRLHRSLKFDCLYPVTFDRKRCRSSEGSLDNDDGSRKEN